MLSQTTLKEFATRFQTTEANIMREYLQNIVLSHLYHHPLSDKLAFKGGTALRLLFNSPRFSEDLDFSGALRAYHVKEILEETFQEISRETIPFEIVDSSPTSGGYFALYRFEVYNQIIGIEFNFSFRQSVKTEPIVVITPLIPDYQCMALPLKQMVKEKMEALLSRKKPRDFFDLYFLLRARKEIGVIIPLKERLLKEVSRLDAKMIQRELKIFLPISMHQILKDFPKTLALELNRL